MKKTFALAVAAFLAACGSDSSAPTPDPGEPNGSIAEATQMTPGTPVVATITGPTDYDYFKFTVPAGGATVLFQTFDQGGTSCDLANDSVDPFVEVYNTAGSLVGWSDDSGINWCEDFSLTLAAGTNYVAVSGYPPYPFVYTLKVTIP